MALPASLQYGAIPSLGCIGNRVYPGLGEDEIYLVLRGKDLHAVVSALATIKSANTALSEYAQGRRQQLATCKIRRYKPKLTARVLQCAAVLRLIPDSSRKKPRA
jgi:hypothetical protein